MITDGSFATDVAVYSIGNVNYPKTPRIEHDFRKFETGKAQGENVSYYGLDVQDPVSMKERLDAVSLTNFVKVIRGAAEKSGYSSREIEFLAPIFMKSLILHHILGQFNMALEQSFILKNFGHVQSADDYISVYEGLKLGRIHDADLVVMLGAGTAFSGKVVAPITVVRRAGQTFAFAQLLLRATVNDTIVVGSNYYYWNVGVAGQGGKVDADQDTEGIGIVTHMADNLGHVLKQLRK